MHTFLANSHQISKLLLPMRRLWFGPRSRRLHRASSINSSGWWNRNRLSFKYFSNTMLIRYNWNTATLRDLKYPNHPRPYLCSSRELPPYRTSHSSSPWPKSTSYTRHQSWAHHKDFRWLWYRFILDPSVWLWDRILRKLARQQRQNRNWCLDCRVMYAGPNVCVLSGNHLGVWEER